MIFFVKGSGIDSSKIEFHDFEINDNALSINDDGDVVFIVVAVTLVVNSNTRCISVPGIWCWINPRFGHVVSLLLY